MTTAMAEYALFPLDATGEIRVLARWASCGQPLFKEYCFVFHMLLHKLFI